MDKKILDLLILEDNPDDAELIVKELEKEGFIVKWNRIDTKQAFKESLADKPDLILVDYNLPSFGGMSALKLQQKLTPDIPLIIVSSTIGEDIAVGCMKAGATDYVLKDKLSRLGPIVRRALRESEEHKERKRTEEKLLVNEKQYQKIFNSTTDSFLIFDMKGNIVEANLQACKMYGYPYKELIKLSGKDIVHPDCYHLFKNFKRDVRTTGEFHAESVDVHKDGTYFDIEVKGTKLDYKGKPHLLAIVRDITQRKKAEEALRESEKRFQQIAENSLEWIWEVDAHGLYTYASPVVEKILGYKPEEIVGKKHFYDLFHPDVRERLKKVAFQVFAKKQSFREFTNWNVNKNKGTVWLSTSGVPILDKEGNLTGYSGADTDITERKKAEEQIRQLQEYLQLQIERMPIGLIIWDKEFRVKSWNPSAERIFGFTVKEVQGKHPYGLIVPKKVQSHMDNIWCRLLEGDTKAHSTIENITKNGNTIICDWINTPLKRVDGSVVGVLSMVQDITERKKAEEIQTTIYNISNAVNTAKNLDEFFEIIHTQLSKIIDTTNFYIALYEKENNTISLPYHVDRRDRFKIFPAGKTLTSYVIKKGKSLLATEKVFKKLEKTGEVELIGKPSKIWLGVPLKIEDEVIGVAAVQSYTDDINYTDNDMKILEFVSDQIAIAIDRKKKGEQIKKDLKEKNVMLMEIHHRVKNNMQVISSMLKMQSGYIRDEQDRELFKDSLTRVKSMALIHEKLYQTKDLANIDFSEYVKSLAMHLFSTFGLDTYVVRLHTNIKDVFLDINTAIPCGLIINELISNSLKYAFPKSRKGNITINLVSKKNTENQKEKIYTLVVSDNGVGFPADVDFRNTESLGLQLVNTLVDQLHGDIKLDRRDGTSFKIVFRRSELKKRSRFY